MTPDEITALARQAGAHTSSFHGRWVMYADDLEKFAGLVAAAEREACAAICDQRKIVTPEWQMDQHYNQAASHCAQAIRLRGRT